MRLREGRRALMRGADTRNSFWRNSYRGRNARIRERRMHIYIEFNSFSQALERSRGPCNAPIARFLPSFAAQGP